MLKEIDKSIHNCNLCNDMVEKFPSSKTVSIGKNNKIVILGEAPANNGWRKSGIAWYDINHKLLPSGVVMQKLLNIINLNLEDTYFLEAIKCYPKDRKYLNKCSNNCRKYLLKQLDEIKPEIILSLGDAATKTILDIKYKKFSDVVGKEYKLNNMTIIPIYHPSPISPKSYTGNIEIFKNLKKYFIPNKKTTYYRAYEQRYKQVYKTDKLWETPISTKEVIKTIQKYNINNKNKILDLGCGEGRDAIELLNKGYNVLAIDYSKTVIDKCNELTNKKYFNKFKQLDIIEDNLNDKYDFIYSVAVLHMFILDEHRNKYYKFIKEHLTNNGYALIITMGDGLEEYSSKSSESFDIVKRTNINTNKEIYIAKTSCKIVNWLNLEKEINNNGLKIIDKYISTELPNFDKCMCVILTK